MGTGLLEIVGLDPNDPQVVAGRADAREFMNLIDALVEIRERRGMTQGEVAVTMGTQQSAVSNFERLGSDPRYSTIQRYARAVGARVRSRAVVDGWITATRTVVSTAAPITAGQVPVHAQLPALSA